MNETVYTVPEKLLAKLEKWFSDEHDRLIEEHKRNSGIIAACIEACEGAHDRAWIKFQYFLQDLGIPCDVTRSWRKDGSNLRIIKPMSCNNKHKGGKT